MEAFYPLIHIEDPWFPKWLLNCEGLIFWHDWYVSQIFQPWLYTDFWLVSALQRQINEIRWNLPSQSSKETKRIVSLWVKAIKRWPWLMRRFESLMKSSIEPNTPTRRDPLPFLLISYQLLDQHNITVNLLTLCPFPEPNSRVLELYAHSFFLLIYSKRWRAARTRFLRSHPMRIIPLAPTWQKLKKKNLTLLVDSWTFASRFMCILTSFSHSAWPSVVDSSNTIGDPCFWEQMHVSFHNISLWDFIFLF